MNSEFYRSSRTDPNEVTTGPQPEYRISLTLSVEDKAALWSAAATRLVDVPDMTMIEVIDVIGPCEDPLIIECITALAKPVSLEGCVLDDFWIDGLKGCPPRSTYDVAVDDRAATTVEQPARRSVRLAT